MAGSSEQDKSHQNESPNRTFWSLVELGIGIAFIGYGDGLITKGLGAVLGLDAIRRLSSAK
jgi:hypothetical protein